MHSLQIHIFVSILMIGSVIFCELEAASANREQQNIERKCGYDGCPKTKPDMLNVHIVAHTHDDVGWLKTVDQYYYGTKIYDQLASVQGILDSVVQELLKDPSRRFIYVESAFFFKWWDKQTPEIQEKVKMLVNEGRLEFIGGAWSMNDEASTHYQSTVDQFTLGLRKLNDTFGECGRPKVGWQIDPFGHSREFASLLAQMGYDGLLLGRIDSQDKMSRTVARNLEMVWHASESLGKKADLFTGVLINTYRPPTGYCFDISCKDDPIIDDKNSPEYNVDKKVDGLLQHFKAVQTAYRSNNILITMGDDFNYQIAGMWFENLDKLIHYINIRQLNGLKVNIFYSTPSCYLKSLYESNITWPSKSDDFFPYASDMITFWTGYFTSRPTLKRFERVGNHYLQVCKQLTALAKKKTSKFEKNLDNLREVMGIMQHHDAVSGTEKQHVANDYARLLQIGIDKCSENIRESLNQLTIDDNNPQIKRGEGFDAKFRFDYDSCEYLNISSCSLTEKSEKFMVTLYNPLAHSTFQYVRIPVDDGDYEIFDYRNVAVKSQLVSIPNEVQSLSFRSSNANNELVFLASELPPMGYKSYFVQKKSSIRSAKEVEPSVRLVRSSSSNSDVQYLNQGSITIGNEYLNLTFDENGLLASAATKDTTMKVRQNFYFYKAMADGGRASGAYIFRPNGSEAMEIASKAVVRVFRGELVDEVHQSFNDWISQVIRIYKNENFAEFQWLVGEIPVGDGIGREIITRFDTDIASNGIFYTDSNGREMLKRTRNHRDTWNVALFEKISGNYYPVTAKIAIEDKNRRLAILNDRAQGGSSLADGSIELMVHRRLLHDDKLGVLEALNEIAYGKGLVVRGSHYLVFGSKKRTEKPSVQATERFLQLQTLLPSSLLFSNVSQFNYDDWKNAYTHIYSGLSLSLPSNIHLLTYEPWKEDSLLIRFEHILAKGEDEKYSKAVTFNFQDVFRGLNVVSIRETTLSADQWLNEAKRFNFTEESDKKNEIPSEADVPEYEDNTAKKLEKESDFMITMKPMEIRTFVAKLR